MEAALPPGCDMEIVAADEILCSRIFKDEKQCGTVAAKSPRGGEDSKTFKDEEHGMTNTSLPPYAGGDDVEQTAHRHATRARVFLAIGLLFEVFSTLWAFHQAVSTGALDGDVDCGYPARLHRLNNTLRVVDNCDGPIDSDVFFSFMDTLANPTSSLSDSTDWEELVSCDELTEAPTGGNSFQEQCSCEFDCQLQEDGPCSWVMISSPSDGICFAQTVFIDSSNRAVTRVSVEPDRYVSRAVNPIGSVKITISALLVALSSQLLEAFVGFKYRKHTPNRTIFTLGASVFEALGVLAVSSVLFSLPAFDLIYDVTIAFRYPIFFWSAWTVVTSVIVGALAEITAECSHRAAGRLPYLGAVGNGLIWLGSALLEIIVTTYLLATWTGIGVLADLAFDIAGLFALELLGLVSMWIARGLWTRSKLLRASVERLERPLGERVVPSHIR